MPSSDMSEVLGYDIGVWCKRTQRYHPYNPIVMLAGMEQNKLTIAYSVQRLNDADNAARLRRGDPYPAFPAAYAVLEYPKPNVLHIDP